MGPNGYRLDQPARLVQKIACSLVIPAYRERDRLPTFLTSIRAYFNRQHGSEFEIIVVDDGSDDGLCEVLAPLQDAWPQLRLIRHTTNLGKGAAVRTGMLAARGDLLLFADADGATPIDEEAKLRAAIDNGADIAVGSRCVARAAVHRPPLRRLGGWLFRSCAHWIVPLPIEDTQCGFKMFRRHAAKQLFGLCDEDGYLFDVFILQLAMQLNYCLCEVPIRWYDVSGPKVHPIRDFLKMLRRLPELRRRIDARIAQREAVLGTEYATDFVERQTAAALDGVHALPPNAAEPDRSGASHNQAAPTGSRYSS